MSDHDMIVTVEGKPYPLAVHDTMTRLTGKETIMLEEYLGGWENFDLGSRSTRSMVVTVWLAMHANNAHTTLENIENIPGLVFGDAVDVEDMPDPPASGEADPTRSIPDVPEGSVISGRGDSLNGTESGLPALWTN